jgi:hypothetical protein
LTNHFRLELREGFCRPFVRRERPLVAHLGDGRRPSWRPVIEVLRANRLPMVEAVISSITRRRGDWVRWRPVFEQVLPWWSPKLAAGIDPLRTSSVHRSTSERAVPEGTTHSPWKSAIRGNRYAGLLLDHLIGGR